jgi:serine phosphatase RsbU (regulator of sigma subunit)
MIPDVEYDEEEREFSSGRLFLFTDGIEEEFNEDQEQFGEERVIRILEQEKDKPLESSIETLYNSMNKFIDTARVRDDITVIGIEYRG